MRRQNLSLVNCPVTPPGLVGPIKVWHDEPTFEEIEWLNPYLELGGHGKPQRCLSRHRVAIVVPYRFVLIMCHLFYRSSNVCVTGYQESAILVRSQGRHDIYTLDTLKIPLFIESSVSPYLIVHLMPSAA